jgi:hypothetical protein
MAFNPGRAAAPLPAPPWTVEETAPSRLLLEIKIPERLPILVAHDEAPTCGRQSFDQGRGTPHRRNIPKLPELVREPSP